MRLEHQFSVPASVDVVWQALVDPERVAPCMPGATLTGVDGNSFTGSVRVKLGPVSLLYKGSGEFVETDETAHRIVMKAGGRDTRGNGTANASVTVTVAQQDGATVTTGTVVTDLAITGRAAQFGRGMVTEVGGKILDTFAGNLATMLGPDAAPEPESPPPADQVKPEPAAQESAAPIDLLGYAGRPVAKRVVPLLAATAALIIILVVWRRRR